MGHIMSQTGRPIWDVGHHVLDGTSRMGHYVLPDGTSQIEANGLGRRPLQVHQKLIVSKTLAAFLEHNNILTK